MNEAADIIGLQINKAKNIFLKIMIKIKHNTIRTLRVPISNVEVLASEEAERLTYLGILIDNICNKQVEIKLSTAKGKKKKKLSQN